MNTDKAATIVGLFTALCMALGPVLEAFGVHGAGVGCGAGAAAGTAALGYVANKASHPSQQ